jgi:protein TonB
MRISFFIFIFTSACLHFVMLTLLLAPPVDEPESKPFKEISIKLGGKKKIEVAKVPTPRVDSPSLDGLPSADQRVIPPQRKIVQQKVAKKEAEPAESLNDVKAKEGEKQVADVKKEAVRKSYEPAGRDVTIPEEEAIVIPTPMRRFSKPSSVDEQQEELLSYEQMLPLWLEQFKIYPEQARVLGLEGEGVITIKVKRDGKVLKKWIEESTGHPILDRALMKMVEDADPVIPIPPDYLPERKAPSYRMKFGFVKGE